MSLSGVEIYCVLNAELRIRVSDFMKEKYSKLTRCANIPLSITNKMQRYTIFFIAVAVLHFAGGFSARRQ
jgi:hypothetical protein